jgi:hypothetical protein
MIKNIKIFLININKINFIKKINNHKHKLIQKNN